MNTTEEMALAAYARAVNNLDPKPLEHILASDFHYSSQVVLEEKKSREDFLNYFRPKLQTIAASGIKVYAEMGIVDAYGRTRPCVILAQGDRDTLVGIALAEVKNGLLKRIDLCVVPAPETARRLGEYPA